MVNLVDYIYKNEQINEMATKLTTFRLLLHNLYKQIIENWCLVKRCDMNQDELISKRLRNHWATELKSYMIKITDEKLKSGRKDKVIKDELINELELNDNNRISDLIRNKFNKEGLEKYKLSLCFAHAMHINVMSEECANNIENICKVLYGNSNDVNDYINGYLG